MFLETSAWHPKDKVWVAERKKEWAFIRNNLKEISYSLIGKSSGYLASHKQLFFEGIVENEVHGDEDFGCQLPLFLMWYHPALTDVVCQEIIEHCNQSVYAARALSDSRKSFFQFAYDKKYKKEYGFMGGREEMIFPQIMGTRASQIIREHDHILYQNPGFIARYCYSGLNCALRSLNSPWHSGQYLWPDYIKPIFDQVEEHYLNAFKMIFKMVLFFDEHPNTCKDDPRSIAFKDKLLAEYQAGELPDSMLKLWDEAKAEGL